MAKGLSVHERSMTQDITNLVFQKDNAVIYSGNERHSWLQIGAFDDAIFTQTSRLMCCSRFLHDAPQILRYGFDRAHSKAYTAAER